jgi:hypothetical protein
MKGAAVAARRYQQRFPLKPPGSSSSLVAPQSAHFSQRRLPTKTALMQKFARAVIYYSVCMKKE